MPLNGNRGRRPARCARPRAANAAARRARRPRALYERVTSGCNQTSAGYPSATLHARFARQAALTPAAVAVSGRSETIDYAALDARAEALANVLAARGAGLGTVVGVALERSVATVVSLLAVLKAGAVYLPLDLSYPPDRLAHMLADSGASLVITTSATELALTANIARIDLDAGATAPLRADVAVTPDHSAYTIYTSGSTGKPKGVAVPHRAAVNLAFARLDHDPIGPGDRILAAISVGFDVSIGQLLLPLLSGAAVVIADDLRTLGAQEFWAFLAAQSVTHINSVPSFFESILDAAPPSTNLVRLMLGGEPLSATLVRRLQRALPHTQVVNMYGPTEACIDATCYPCRNDETAPVCRSANRCPTIARTFSTICSNRSASASPATCI